MTNSFYGLSTRKIENQSIRLEYLADMGPRIVRVFIQGFEGNFLAEVPDFIIETSYGPFSLRGGHRLWHAPESNPRTYIPDDEALEVEELENGVRLVQPLEAATGIEKEVEIHLDGEQAALTIEHRITNHNLWPIELAPWALTLLPIGGVAILPSQTTPVDEHGLLPNRQLVIWPYNRWDDPRLLLYDDYTLIDAQPLLPPVKIGYFNQRGWVAFYQAGTLFCKRFEVKEGDRHPDFGCNVECYCNDQFLELETLGPLAALLPGQSVRHTERWEFYPQLDFPANIAGIREMASFLKL